MSPCWGKRASLVLSGSCPLARALLLTRTHWDLSCPHTMPRHPQTPCQPVPMQGQAGPGGMNRPVSHRPS